MESRTSASQKVLSMSMKLRSEAKESGKNDGRVSHRKLRKSTAEAGGSGRVVIVSDDARRGMNSNSSWLGFELIRTCVGLAYSRRATRSYFSIGDKNQPETPIS
jgi:hypothetical protein